MPFNASFQFNDSMKWIQKTAEITKFIIDDIVSIRCVQIYGHLRLIGFISQVWTENSFKLKFVWYHNYVCLCIICFPFLYLVWITLSSHHYILSSQNNFHLDCSWKKQIVIVLLLKLNHFFLLVKINWLPTNQKKKNTTKQMKMK